MWIVAIRACRCLLRQMSGYQLDHANVVTEKAELGFRLFEQVLDFALVWIVTKQALADGHGPVNK